ncbi:TIR domain-containing protein [Babesia caballi]|uniref:TIR domain-containing protein n=1 Tax=Babesia caballi TaxID=5871 RepID=A0AAV4M1R2_BABCB|nr:TIR domain-containing protein [Babesia caballi]
MARHIIGGEGFILFRRTGHGNLEILPYNIMDMPEEIPELRSRCEAYQPVKHLSDRGRGSGLCSILLVLMAEVRCGAKVESGEEMVVGGGVGRTLPGSETVTPKRL